MADNPKITGSAGSSTDEATTNAETTASMNQTDLLDNDESKNSNQDDTVEASTFRDTSTDCAICLGSLDDPDMEVIELKTCGHRWHVECLKEQLEQAQPNPAQRLVLQGCRCAKCGSVCQVENHPALQHLARKTDALLDKVNSVLKEQLEDNEKNDAKALEEARRKYAVYLCSHCKEPYFGGTIDCADTAEGEVPPEERLCVACAPDKLQQAHCRHPLEHRGAHIWKCRYCCNVATHVCYGTVHFCRDCHDRNSKRVAILQQHRYNQRQRQQMRRQHENDTTTNNEPPSCLEAITCPGGDACPFPKPDGATHHKNGSSADCEQAYACAWCQSSPTAAEHGFDEPPGSRNFLKNGSGETGDCQHWQRVNRASSWQTEISDTPLSATVTTNFVSNFQWCVMTQTVPLHRYIRDPSSVRIEASAKYMARTDCPSTFVMELIVLNARHQVVARQRAGPMAAPADFWERASLVMDPTPGAHEAIMVVHGKDNRFWRGNFGSKVTDCQLRVLGTPDELANALLEVPQEEVEQANARGQLLRALGQPQQLVLQNWWQQHKHWVEFLVPALCFLFLAWWHQ